MDDDLLGHWLFYRHGKDTRPWWCLTDDERAHWVREGKLVRRMVELNTPGSLSGQSTT